MRQQYTEVTHVTWFEKLSNSCLGAILGLIVFLLSFYVLFWNEGRVNVAAVVKTAPDISTVVNPAPFQGKLVSASGVVVSTGLLGDNLFLRPGRYVLVDRTVEMYAWSETRQTDKQKHAGGSETQVTTYTYSTGWTNQPESSSSFRYPDPHQNPPKPFPDQLYRVPSVRIGPYTLNLSYLGQVSNHRVSCPGDAVSSRFIQGLGVTMPASGRLQLDAQNTQIKGRAIRTPEYIFQGLGAPDRPQIGDIRVCYTVLPAAQMVTAFGQLEQAEITTHWHQKTVIHRLIPGSRAAAIAVLGHEETLWRWLWRLAGFGMMWGGLTFVGLPLVAVADVIPWLGWIVEDATVAGSFVTALMLSIITILVSALVHHPVVLIGVIGGVLGGLAVMRHRRR